jgi:hypothetical protein
MILNILKKSTVVKGCKFSLHSLNFVRVGNRNGVLCNSSILQFRSDQIEKQHL